jgi:hypothetical protein
MNLEFLFERWKKQLPNVELREEFYADLCNMAAYYRERGRASEREFPSKAEGG